MAESGELLMPGFADMATRASFIGGLPNLLAFWSNTARKSTRLGCAGIAARGATRCVFIQRPRSDPDHAAAGTIADAKDFAQRHGGWIGRASRPLAEAAPFHPGTVVPLRGVAHPHRCIGRLARTVWTEVRDSGERILSASPAAVEHIDRRVHDYLKRQARSRIQKRRRPMLTRWASKVSGCRSAISRAAGVRAPPQARCRSPWR